MRTYFETTTGRYLGTWNWPATPEQLDHPDLAGHPWKEGQAGSNLHRLNLLTGTVELIPIPYEYVSLRASAYPSLGDQLDMIFHAGGGGAAFQASIAAVKARYPK